MQVTILGDFNSDYVCTVSNIQFLNCSFGKRISEENQNNVGTPSDFCVTVRGSVDLNQTFYS